MVGWDRELSRLEDIARRQSRELLARANDPTASDYTASPRAMHLKIEHVALTEVVGRADDRVLMRCGRIEQRSPQHLSVLVGQAKTGFEYPCFVSAARMERVQAIVAQLGKISDGLAGVWYPHLGQDIGSARRPGPICRVRWAGHRASPTRRRQRNLAAPEHREANLRC